MPVFVSCQLNDTIAVGVNAILHDMLFHHDDSGCIIHLLVTEHASFIANDAGLFILNGMFCLYGTVRNRNTDPQ